MPHQPVTEEKKTPYKAVKEKKSVTEKKPKAYPSHVDNPERELTEFEMFLLAKNSTAKFVQQPMKLNIFNEPVEEDKPKVRNVQQAIYSLPESEQRKHKVDELGKLDDIVA